MKQRGRKTLITRVFTLRYFIFQNIENYKNNTSPSLLLQMSPLVLLHFHSLLYEIFVKRYRNTILATQPYCPLCQLNNCNHGRHELFPHHFQQNWQTYANRTCSCKSGSRKDGSWNQRYKLEVYSIFESDNLLF